MVLWVQVFGVYSPLDMVHLLSAPSLVLHECLPLVVLASFISVAPLEVHQVCLGGIGILLPVVLGPPTVC